MCECPDYDDGTRHTCEACVGDLETMREKLAASEAARREAERDLAASRSLQEGTAALLGAAERRAEESEAKLADEERQRGEALTRICAEFNVTSSLQLASLAERDDETTIDLVIKLIRSSFSARERAEARLRETEAWHKAAVRERDLMREQMDEILRYEDIEMPGPDENVASVVLAALEHLREARVAAERELASLTTDRDSWVEQADQRATEAVEYLRRATAAESRLSRATTALREIDQKTGHFGEAPPPPEWMPMLSLIAWVGRTARAALAGQEKP